MRKLYISLFIIAFCFNAFAQKEANYWYFGRNAGINFNSGSPVAVTNGKLSTLEGCSSISDASGNLLFYTDGITVYNKNHATMTNGTGLKGDPSSTQSGIIIPKPGSSSTYYIFTVDMQGGLALFAGGDADGTSNGLMYSEVDMTASSGLGAVTATKNIALTNPTTEGLSAVRDANGIDYWVLAHGCNNNTYYAYHITSAGVNTTPVVSNTGPVVSVTSLYSGAGALGYMKISPNGKKVAACHTVENNQVVLSDFNSATGVVSNSITIPILYDGESGGPYGCEFSNCNEYLYVTEQFYKNDAFWGTIWPRETKIWRFDLSAADIPGSKSQFASINAEENGALQLATDGKIYVAQRIRTGSDSTDYGFASGSNLHAINNPRTAGATLSLNAVNLAGKKCEYGLPPFIASFFYNTSFSASNLRTGDTSTFCIGDTAIFQGYTTIYDSIRWYFGDPGTGINNTSTLLNPKHPYAQGGNYYIQLYKYMCGFRDSAVKTITVSAFPVVNDISDVTVCSGASVTIDGTASPVTSYSWNTGATTPAISVNTPGKYVITASNNGCLSKDSMILSNSAATFAVVSIDVDQNPTCSGTNVTFTAIPAVGLVSPTYQWYLNDVLQPGATNSTYSSNTLSNNDLIKVVLTASGCVIGSPATSNEIIATIFDKPVIATIATVNCTTGIVTVGEATIDGDPCVFCTYKLEYCGGCDVNASPVGTTNSTGVFDLTGATSAGISATYNGCKSAIEALTFTDTPYNCPYILPIELNSFTGICDNNNVVLAWETVSELNNDYFTVYKSIDAIKWESLGNIKAAGNSNSIKNYGYTDVNPVNGITYYKLKQIDFNGSGKYSAMISVNCQNTENLNIVIQPNPSDGIFTVLNLEKNTDISIYNSTGQKIIQFMTPYEKTKIDLSNYQDGIYYLKLITKNQIRTERIILKK